MKSTLTEEDVNVSSATRQLLQNQIQFYFESFFLYKYQHVKWNFKNLLIFFELKLRCISIVSFQTKKNTESKLLHMYIGYIYIHKGVTHRLTQYNILYQHGG